METNNQFGGGLPAPSEGGRGCGCGAFFLLAAVVVIVLGVVVVFGAISDIGRRERQKMEHPDAVRARERAEEARKGFHAIRDESRRQYRRTGKVPESLNDLDADAALYGRHFRPSNYIITTARGTTVYLICTLSVGENFTFSFDIAGTSEGEMGVSRIN